MLPCIYKNRRQKFDTTTKQASITQGEIDDLRGNISNNDIIRREGYGKLYREQNRYKWGDLRDRHKPGEWRSGKRHKERVVKRQGPWQAQTWRIQQEQEASCTDPDTEGNEMRETAREVAERDGENGDTEVKDETGKWRKQRKGQFI